MPRKVMNFVVQNINKENEIELSNKGEKYRGIIFDGKKTDNYYHWHGVYDNCAHPIINTLAKVGILPFKKVNQTFLKQLAYIAIPSNTLLDIHSSLNSKN